MQRSDADYDRLRGYAERLDADVIAVQEVDGEAALRRVFDDDLYDYHVASQSGVQLTGFAYKATLQITPNPDYAELDVGSIRIGTDLTVAVNGHALRLLSVHLKSGCFDQPLTTAGQRLHEARRLCPLANCERVGASRSWAMRGAVTTQPSSRAWPPNQATLRPSGQRRRQGEGMGVDAAGERKRRCVRVLGSNDLAESGERTAIPAEAQAVRALRCTCRANRDGNGNAPSRNGGTSCSNATSNGALRFAGSAILADCERNRYTLLRLPQSFAPGPATADGGGADVASLSK